MKQPVGTTVNPEETELRSGDIVSKTRSLVYWIEEREQNALLIADTKHDADREDWLEDASYFSQCKQSALVLANVYGPDPNCPLRAAIALRILRAWNSGTAGFDGQVVVTINNWIDAGMKGPIPFPDNPFFREWAQENGLSDAGGFVGLQH
jgi:hypothetical protein